MCHIPNGWVTNKSSTHWCDGSQNSPKGPPDRTQNQGRSPVPRGSLRGPPFFLAGSGGVKSGKSRGRRSHLGRLSCLGRRVSGGVNWPIQSSISVICYRWSTFSSKEKVAKRTFSRNLTHGVEPPPAKYRTDIIRSPGTRRGVHSRSIDGAGT